MSEEMARSTEKTEESMVKVVPSTDAIEPSDIREAFDRLHRLGTGFELEVRLTKTEDAVEFTIIVPGDHRTTVEETLRRLFPVETEFTSPSTRPTDIPAEPTAALELLGQAARRRDWQTRLKPVVNEDDSTSFPLASVADALANSDSRVVYQAVLAPKVNWKADADLRVDDLVRNRDTPGQRFLDSWLGPDSVDEQERSTDPAHRERIESIEETDPRRSFVVNARAIATGPDAERVLETIGNAFQAADGPFYFVEPRVHTDDEQVERIREQIENAELVRTPPFSARLQQRLPVTANTSQAIVTDPETAPNFCLLDGDSLTTEGRRAMQATPGEQTGVPHPDQERLDQYDHGLLLGHPLTSDDEPLDTPVSLPPSLQPLHTAWFGKTGSGKSTALINAILENHQATDGADILIDSKGDGMPVEYLRAHYAEHGNLDDVYYFDCTQTLPAISFFDIRDQLDNGIDRTTAVEDVVDHYVEILVGIMGRDRFERAVRSPDIIRYLVKAMFDPVHGHDAFSHRDLQESLRRMHETRDAPPVVDRDLQGMLGGVAANSKRSFHELMQGVANRIEKIPLDDRLGQLFNHVPEQQDDPRLDLREVIDEDALVIIDTGGLRTESQRAVTLVVLSQLWTALQRRAHTTDHDQQADHPLVNLYLEEAASVATSGLLTDLLAQSRSFGLSMTLAMQFPAQLRQADHEAYHELLNNVSTIVTGNVAVDDALTKRLATEDMTPSHVANRLRALRRGQWFVSLPSAFGVDEPRPFLLESAPIPSGHSEADDQFEAAKETAFAAAFDVARDQTRLEHGLDVALQARQATMSRHRAASVESTEPVRAEDSEVGIDPDARVDSALPYTKRMPEVVEYDAEKHALVCGTCDSRFDPTSDGMEYAIRCCHTLADVDRDDVPICELNLKLSVDERRQSPYTDAQLRFLQAIYSAHQRRFDSELEYDLLYDSMIRLQEYTGVENPEVQELLDAGLLAEDCSYPHKLYTVTPEGREAAKIQHREGIAHGDGQGDLSESSLHVAMVELGRQYIEHAFVNDEQSDVVQAVAYHEVDDYRLDAAGLDADGEVVVTLEAERSNHDTLRAVPEDYDKMARHDPEAAIWIVKNRDGGHDVLDALNDPPAGEVRVEKEYSRSSPPQRFKIDEPGLTEMYTFQYLRDSILE